MDSCTFYPPSELSFITEHLAIYILFEFFADAFPLRKCINMNWKLCCRATHNRATLDQAHIRASYLRSS